MATTNVSLDVRDLLTVRVTKFEITDQYSPALPKYADILFEIQVDKTRAVLETTIHFGVLAGDATPPDVAGTVMTVYSDAPTNSVVKPYEDITQEAWMAVMHTTAANQMGGAAPVTGFADVTWDTVVDWVMDETQKPSLSQTVGIL